MNCKVLKLKSGEEIICDLVQHSKSKYEIINPFVFKTITVMDIEGRPCDVTLVKDWLSLTTVKKTTIPMNHVATVIDPSSNTKMIYKQELTAKKQALKNKTSKPIVPKLNKSPLPIAFPKKDAVSEEEMLQFLQNIFGDIFNKDTPENDFSNSTTPEDLHKNPHDIYNEMYPPRKRKASNFKNRPMIQMTMMFPPEVIIDLMEAGFININDIDKIAREVKKNLKYTGDERHRPDFGNKASDWNSDPRSDDYK